MLPDVTLSDKTAVSYSPLPVTSNAFKWFKTLDWVTRPFGCLNVIKSFIATPTAVLSFWTSVINSVGKDSVPSAIAMASLPIHCQCYNTIISSQQNE